MINEETLNRCLDNLAEINANLTNSALKRLTLEIGYVLKQELDNVVAWNRQITNDRGRGKHNVDVQKLMEDNTQLFNENKALNELNLKLKQIIDERIPKVEREIGTINNKFTAFSEVLSKP